ncbi:MAG TPA: hypothetical protein VIT65_06000 [Microlunatus sp.]
MTLLIGGENTALAGVPKHWRGPLPDPFVTRMLKPKGSFYKKIPMSLLDGAAPDLGVMVWALLRLSFDGQANVGSYRMFAQCLNLDHLSDTAVDKRFGAALKPLLGTWINRKRLPDNSYRYEAAVPAAAASDRYAILRPSDVDLLAVTPPKGLESIEVSDLVDFCRWQLECGRRGWTVDPLRNIADRWKVTHPTMARSRDRLAKLGLLKVVPRTGGRFSDLIWLEELYNPHWQVPSIIDEETDQDHAGHCLGDGTDAADLWKVNGRFLGKSATGSLENGAAFGRKTNGRSDGSSTAGPIQGIPTEYSTEDPTELGGTSVPTLTLLPRELADAPPPASSSEEHITGDRSADHRHTAARLIGRHRVLAAAKPHFRTAMLRRLTAALEQGLAPGHADRALVLVTEEGAFDAECLLLKQALQQAWIAQRVGMCADCGDRGRHSPGCSQFDFSWDVGIAAGGHRDNAPESSSPGLVAASDPIGLLLQRPVGDPDALRDDAEIVDWMIVQLARQIAGAPDREATLRTVWTWWRAKLHPDHRPLLDHANEHVRYALDQRRAS